MNERNLPDEKIDYVIELYSNNKIKETLNEINFLIDSYNPSAVLLNIQGACFNNLGIHNMAEKSFLAAIQLEKNSPSLYYNLGNTYKEIGRPEDAIKNYERALDLNPDYIEAIYNLGVTLQEQELFEDAIEQFQELLLIDPQNISAKLNLGFAYQALEYYEEATTEFEKILDIEPMNKEALNNLGTINRQMNKVAESIKYYEKAIKMNPRYAGAYYNLGFIYQDIGQIEKAIESYEKSIEIDFNTQSYHNLSYLKKFDITDPHIDKMRELLSNEKLSTSDRIQLSLALAKVYESLEMQEDFFKFLNEGNRLQKEKSNYSFSQSSNFQKAIIGLFKEKLPSINNLNIKKKSIKRPIFIVGMPRSGTSLVEQILASHHSVYGAGELNTITKLSSPVIKNYALGDINQLTEQMLLFIRNEYMNMLSNFKIKENVITDKLPLNFQFIGIILLAFPEAKIIHLKRDARATCWSNYKYYFKDKENGYSNNFEDLANFYISYTKLMKFWHRLFPNKIYDLCYEDLIQDQENETRKLLKYLELDWDEDCLDFHNNDRAVKTVSALQVRKKIYQNSSIAWKKYWAYIEPLIKALKSY